MSIERFLVYLFFTAPTSLVTTTLADPDILHILRFHMNEQIEQVVSDRLGYGTTAHTVLGVVDTPVAPFRNGTVVATLSVAVGLHTPDSSLSATTILPHALDTVVTAAITDPTWRDERLSVYAVLNRIYAVSTTTTPEDWTSILDDFHDRSRNNSNNTKWYHALYFWTADFWAPIDWGNWRDVQFLLFCSILSGCSLVTLCCCGIVSVCRHRQRRKQQQQADDTKCAQVLAAASTLEAAMLLEEDEEQQQQPEQLFYEEEILVEDDNDDDKNTAHRSRPGSNNPRGALSNTSSYSYIEEEVVSDTDDDDIQSFAVNPGSTYDFGVSGIADTGSYYEEETIVSEVEEVTVHDDDFVEVVSKRSVKSHASKQSAKSHASKTSTISQHPVNLDNESQKGTVVVFNNDSESVSTASDSVLSAVFDFAKAAWEQKPKPKVPSAIRRRQEGGGVRAAIATFEKVAHPSPLSPDKTVPLPRLDSSNVLGIVSKIETENRALETMACGPSDEEYSVVDVEAGNGDVVTADDDVGAPDVVERIAPVVTQRSSTPLPRKRGVLSSLSRLLFAPSRRQQQNMSVVLSDIEDGLTAPSAARTSGDSLVSAPPDGEELEGLEPPATMREVAGDSQIQELQAIVCPNTTTATGAKPPKKGTSVIKLFQKKEHVAMSEKSSVVSVKSIPSQPSTHQSMPGSHKQDAVQQIPPDSPPLPATESWKGPGRWRSRTPPATRSQFAAPASPISQSSRCSSAPSSPQTSVAKAGTVLSRISVFEKKAPANPPIVPRPPPRRFVPRPKPSDTVADASVPGSSVKSIDPVDKARQSPVPHAGDTKDFKATTIGLTSPSISTATTAQSLCEDCFSDGGKAPSVQTTLPDEESTDIAPLEEPKETRSVLAVAKQFDIATQVSKTADVNTVTRSRKTKAMERSSDFIDLSKSKTSSLSNTRPPSPRKSKRSVADAVKAFETMPSPKYTVDSNEDAKADPAFGKVDEATPAPISAPSETTRSSVPDAVISNLSARAPSPVTLGHCDESNDGESAEVPAWLKAFKQIQAHSSPTESFEARETIPLGHEMGYSESGAIMVADDDLSAGQPQKEERSKPGRPRGRSRRPNHQNMSPVNLTNRMDDRLGDMSCESEQNISSLSVEGEIDDIDPPVVKFPFGRRAQSATPLDRQTSSFLPSWGRPSSRNKNASMPSGSDPVEESVQPKGSYILRTNLSKAFKGRRTQSAAPRDRQKADILRNWSDTKTQNDKKATASFAGNSARPSKATKKVLKTNTKSPGTPATLPSTPMSQIEYQDSETSDIKSICSKDPVFALYENAQRTPNASPAKGMSSLRPNDQERNLVTVSEGEVVQTSSRM